MTTEELLSGTDGVEKRSTPSNFIIVDKNTELGQFILEFQNMEDKSRERIMGYFKALKELQE